MSAPVSQEAREAAEAFIGSWPRQSFADFIEPALAEAFDRAIKAARKDEAEKCVWALRKIEPGHRRWINREEAEIAIRARHTNQIGQHDG